MNKLILLSFAVFILGIRHGFDLDHLAAIDAITRTARKQFWLSKLIGALFSLGHGIVVISLSTIIGVGWVRTKFPAWLDPLGTCISILFLLLFGGYNLVLLFHHSSESSLTGFKTVFLKRFLGKPVISPFTVLGIGALFALSFDTFTQVSLFALSGSAVTVWAPGILAIIFTAGMMLSDGLNGILAGLLLRYLDKKSPFASRLCGFIVSFFSLIIGGLGIYSFISN